MNIEIKTTKANTAYNSHAFCADVKVNGKWFKQITSSETDKDKFELECLQITIDDLKQDSQSPTEPEMYFATEFDTLVEGDWFIGTEEDYKKVLKLENHKHYRSTHKIWIQHIVNAGGCLFDCGTIHWHRTNHKTQLTVLEFIRRADNTFKTKNK